MVCNICYRSRCIGRDQAMPPMMMPGGHCSGTVRRSFVNRLKDSDILLARRRAPGWLRAVTPIGAVPELRLA